MAGVTEPGWRSSPALTLVAKLWSVISVTTAEPPVASATLPTSPAPLITGSPRWMPSSRPLLIVTCWYQLLGERTIDVRVHRPVLAHALGVRLVEQAALLGLREALLHLHDLGAVRVALLDRLVALVLGVDRVAEPPEEIAHGLEDAAGAFLDRAQDTESGALN